MNKIAICIPTYKRPVMLKKLLLSILKCSINTSLIKDISIHILDNDKEKGAEYVVKEIKNEFKQLFSIHYFDYPVRGIANVRNELLRKALARDPQFIIFIDDDEYPEKEWINELLFTITSTNADMAMGPVVPVFNQAVPPSISCWFERPKHKPNARIYFTATNNLIIRVATLLANNIWFDSRFNASGAEDAYFGLQMRKKGAVIVWATNAVVYENTPEERTRIFWLMKRRYRGASNFVFELKLEKQYFKIILKFIKSLVYIFTGFLALVLLLVPVERKFWGVLKVSEGIGGIAGMLNLRLKGY